MSENYIRPYTPEEASTLTERVLSLDSGGLFQEAVTLHNPPPGRYMRFGDTAPVVACLALSGKSFSDLHASNRSRDPTIGISFFFREVWASYHEMVRVKHGVYVTRDDPPEIDVHDSLEQMENGFFWNGLKLSLMGFASTKSGVGHVFHVLDLFGPHNWEAIQKRDWQTTVEVALLDKVAQAFVAENGSPKNYEFRPRGATVTVLRPR